MTDLLKNKSHRDSLLQAFLMIIYIVIDLVEILLVLIAHEWLYLYFFVYVNFFKRSFY